MRILALDPYLGGSHAAFFDGVAPRSRHSWAVLGAPPQRSSLRVRHASITLAAEVAQRAAAGECWDLLFCSDMLSLAEFRGLVPETVRVLPTVAYFFENQLTCPVRHEQERDPHAVLSNLTTAIAAEHVWFNSDFHRNDFLQGLTQVTEHSPENPIGREHLAAAAEQIKHKSTVWYPGIESRLPRGPRPRGPMRILWVARWEHDQNPDTFFQALQMLKWQGAEFRLSVIGQQFLEHPPAFDWARQYFYFHIDWWGYQPNRYDYEDALAEADVVVSTADYEFFGLSTLEAIAAGAYPVLPARLAFPEMLGSPDEPATSEYFYEGGARQLADRLILLAERTRDNNLWMGASDRARNIVSRFHWDRLVPALDDELERIGRCEELRGRSG